ncbi:uncharacterized protein SAPINGB_P000736 [Magnusiomyces paraingens]|uniref:Ammonia transport outward protein 2 n=1 Tax=Magnusiomyces paraingens TaxID=2606893 RepID=A0A5E8B3C4_9ASCO|nr:uncharacterized protein SAPINGB_P000736 [Saprochaete ingens]VVT45396.1 unnamed protein product [Saprochaete ingens]
MAAQEHFDLEKQSDYPGETGTPIARIQTSGQDNEILHIGDTKVYKHELMAAFGGSLNVGLSEAPSRKFANPGPLGLSAFALTTFCLSLVNVQARGVTNASGVVGLAYFYGGIIQLLAGMWEIVVENNFGATALSSYGGFWLGWAALNTKAFGLRAAYSSDREWSEVVGFFLLGWLLFNTMLLMLTLKSTFIFFILFFVVELTFLFLTIGHIGHSTACNKAGGYFGLIASVLAWYNAYAGLATHENSYFVPKVIYMPGTVLPEKKK